MIENTIRNFVPELHRILAQEGQSYTARIIATALPRQSLFPEQVEHLYSEFRYILDAEYEFFGNPEIIKNFLKDFPFDKVVAGNEGDERFFINRYVLNFRQNYLEPKLYLIDEQTLQDLESRGLTPVSATESAGNATEILAQDQAGNQFTASYYPDGQLSNLQPTYQQESFSQSESAPVAATPSTTRPESGEQAVSSQEAQGVAIAAEQHLQMQLDESSPANVPDFITSADPETENETTNQALQARITAEQEVESMEQNRQKYMLQETTRQQQLQMQQQQSETNRTRQRMAKSSKRIAIAAGAGATVFSGGIAGIVVLGDLIGLFS